MKCTYINLDNAAARKTQIEESFAAHRGPDWELTRFPAIDTRFVEQQQIKGRIRPAEKACFLSHRAVIESNVGASAPVFVLEDDAIFGGATHPTIDNFLGISDSYNWDIIFTDLCVTQLGTMAELIKLRHQLTEIDQVRLLDVTGFVFAGATAYIVNHKSIGKLAALLGAEKELNVPYDLVLRKYIYEKKLKGLVFFPFITSISEESEVSQIQQEASADMIWNAFRKLVWTDRNLGKVSEAVKNIDRDLCDEESRLLGGIFAGLVSKSFVPK
jgi:GR25 family glycosyltransferase involved in LPS biosynthesis